MRHLKALLSALMLFGPSGRLIVFNSTIVEAAERFLGSVILLGLVGETVVKYGLAPMDVHRVSIFGVGYAALVSIAYGIINGISAGVVVVGYGSLYRVMRKDGRLREIAISTLSLSSLVHVSTMIMIVCFAAATLLSVGQPDAASVSGLIFLALLAFSLVRYGQWNRYAFADLTTAVLSAVVAFVGFAVVYMLVVLLLITR